MDENQEVKKYLSDETLDLLCPKKDTFMVKKDTFMEKLRKIWQRHVKWPACKFAQDITYTVKLVRGVLSGFDDLQYRDGDAWEYVPYATYWYRLSTGEGSGWIRYAYTDRPYYVCVAWKNGSHTPLPLILHWEGEYPLQNRVLKVFNWIANHKNLCVSFERAFKSCAEYKHQFYTPLT